MPILKMRRRPETYTRCNQFSPNNLTHGCWGPIYCFAAGKLRLLYAIEQVRAPNSKL